MLSRSHSVCSPAPEWPCEGRGWPRCLGLGHSCGGPSWGSRILALAWPSPGHGGHVSKLSSSFQTYLATHFKICEIHHRSVLLQQSYLKDTA